MIIVSSRKFRDNQNTYFEKANSEEVILQTLRYGSFRLVPVREGDAVYQDVRRASAEKNAALVANFHKGEKTAVPASVSAPSPVPGALDLAELVKTAVQEAVAAAVPAAAAAAAAAQAQMQPFPMESEPKPQRTARAPRKSSALKAKAEAQQKNAAAESEDDRPQLVLQPSFPDPAPAEASSQPVAEPATGSAPEPPASSEYQTLFTEENPARTSAAPVKPLPAEPEEKPAREPAASARPARQEPVRPAPVQSARQIPRVALPVEEELEHEPIPEPSEEVRRHIHPVTEASPDVKPDFVDPGLYTDYEDSYIVGEERPDLEAQLAAYRKQEKGGFFKRLFKK